MGGVALKTYFDLTSKDREKYRDDFVKTSVGKSLFDLKNKVFIVFSVLFVLYVLMVLFIGDNVAVIVIEKVLYFVFFAFLFSWIYFDLNFSAWLKNKHDIKRW